MAKLPIEPTYAKALLLGLREPGCSALMLSLVAMLSVDGSAFINPPAAARGKADDAHRRFICAQADTITDVNVLNAYGYRQGDAARAWCDQHFLNRRTLDSARQVREQLMQSAARLHLLPKSATVDEETQAAEVAKQEKVGISQLDMETSKSLRRCLLGAFFHNAAQKQPSGEYLALVSRESVAVHPSSVLFSRRCTCLLFNELLYTTKLYMRKLTQIDDDWLPELAPQLYAGMTNR